MSKLDLTGTLAAAAPSAAIAGWVHRLGEVWVEGQVAQLTRRPGVPTTFLTVRDTDANISMTASRLRLPSSTVPRSPKAPDRHARPPGLYARNEARFSLRASAIRQVGIGELLVRHRTAQTTSGRRGCSPRTAKAAAPLLPAAVPAWSPGRCPAPRRATSSRTPAGGARPPGSRRSSGRGHPGPAAVSGIVAALGRPSTPSPTVDRVSRRRPRRRLASRTRLPFTNETLLRAVVAALHAPVVQRHRPRRTRRCSTSSPTCALRRRRRTPASESCPTATRRNAGSPACAGEPASSSTCG